jgi:hypothetical protein
MQSALLEMDNHNLCKHLKGFFVDDNAVISSGASALWSSVLTIGIGVMAYLVRKRDDKISSHDNAIDAQQRAHSALELKVAENYATKTTVATLFNEVTTQNKEAIARVDKRLDETNNSIIKASDKMDKILETVNTFQTNVMSELGKKT